MLRKYVSRSVALAILVSVATYPMFGVAAETLADYVTACKEQLGFDSIPRFSCKGEQFRKATSGTYLGLNFSQSDDFVAHQQVNGSVDAVFACRWLGHNGDANRAVSGEMIVHNRFSGGSCFFELKDTFENSAYPQVEINPAPPTDTGASRFWRNPSDVAICTRCHTAGAYIASPEIVGALAKFGLLNDGHDVWGGFYNAVGSNNSAFAQRLNAEIQNITQPDCASQCHVMRGDPQTPSIIGAGLVTGAVVIPSINHTIAEVIDKNAMAPTGTYSNYRWINRHGVSSRGDFERLTDVKREYPAFYCASPKLLQAHVVDDTTTYQSNDLADAVATFNLQEGLVCYNADQTSGKCADYQTRYLCNGEWGDWQNNDTPDLAGDYERRSKYTFPASCAEPAAIQAKYISGGRMYVVNGPPDRLNKFDRKGLICLNDDQPSGEPCHNYAVRFICE